MHTNLKGCLTALIVFFSLCFSACKGDTVSGKAWEAILDGMPPRLRTEDAGINTTQYILKQTHEPLFRIDDGENYTSKLLKNWNRSADSRNYVFCPDTSLLFERGRGFSLDFFELYLHKIVSAFDPDGKISRVGDCFDINFKNSRKQFLSYLTLYDHAPTIKKNDNTEIGLGPYYPESISEHAIILRKKILINNGYNSIIIYPYTGPNDKNLENRNVADFNRIAVSAIPLWAQQEYAHFDSVILKTVVLIINSPDKNLRRILYNCIDTHSFRQAFYPNRKNFVNIQNILPVGIFGGIGGIPHQQCVFRKQNMSILPPLVFINLGSNNANQLKSFLINFSAKTGIIVEIKNYPDNEIFNALFSYPRKYNLTVVAMDAVRPDHTSFFEYFAKDTGYLDFKSPQFSQLYQKLLHEDDPDKKNIIGAQMAQALSEEYVVLPLYQDKRRFYYPRNVKNLTVGRGFLEYPEIAEFRW